LLVDFCSLLNSAANEVITKLFCEEVSLVLAEEDKLLVGWNFATDFAADDHVKQVTIAFILKHHVILRDKQVLHNRAHLLNTFLVLSHCLFVFISLCLLFLHEVEFVNKLDQEVQLRLTFEHAAILNSLNNLMLLFKQVI